MAVLTSPDPIGEARPRAVPDEPRRSRTVPQVRAGPVPEADVTGSVPPPHQPPEQRRRARTQASDTRSGPGFDRQGRDRRVQRAAALRSLYRMHCLALGDAERDTLRTAVITEYMPYARHLAARYLVHGQPAEDLFQAAYIGLVMAVDRFDPDIGTVFLSFATPTICGELKRHFRDTTWAVHVPRRIKELSGEVGAATQTLSQRLNRAPTVPELSLLMGAGAAEVVDAIGATGLHTLPSLDASAANGGGARLGDLRGTEDPEIQNVVDRQTLRPLLAALSAREKKILVMRFFRGMTQSEIAEELGVSQMQVSRLLAGIINRLRRQAGCDPR